MFDNSEFLTVEEGAKVACMGKTNFSKLARKDDCPFAKRIGRRIIISKKKLVEFLNSPESVAI
jgi:hypothetical protein